MLFAMVAGVGNYAGASFVVAVVDERVSNPLLLNELFQVIKIAFQTLS
jgi:hypothetical protein